MRGIYTEVKRTEGKRKKKKKEKEEKKLADSAIGRIKMENRMYEIIETVSVSRILAG